MIGKISPIEKTIRQKSQRPAFKFFQLKQRLLMIEKHIIRQIFMTMNIEVDTTCSNLQNKKRQDEWNGQTCVLMNLAVIKDTTA
jgi:hypothetical protein